MLNSNNNNIDTKWPIIDLDDIDSDFETYSDNELPLSSISNVLSPIDRQKIKEEVDYQAELNINNDYKSKTSLLSNQEQNEVDNVNTYGCDICGKIFQTRYLIIKHFQRSLCFPKSPRYFKSNSSKFHNKYKNFKKSILHNGNNSLVTKNIKKTHKCRICPSYAHNFKLFKRNKVLHTNKNNLEHDIFSNHSYKCKNARRNKNQWKCQICKKSLTKLSTLKVHIHNKNKLFSCDKCNDSFRHLNCLKKHKLIHTSNCQICHKQYSEPSLFTAHNKNQCLKSINLCNACRKQINFKSNESKHINKINNSSKNYECSRCSKVFHKRSEIISHIFENHQEDYSKYSCDTCANSYVTLPDFVLHFEKKMLKCDICSQSLKFTSSQRLRQHYKWHIGINNFGCQYCPLSFSEYSAYLNHENTHIEEKPFRCHYCGKWFPVSSNLNIHLRFHNPFARNICKKPLATIPTLLPREKIHPKENQLSESCYKVDNFMNELNKEYKCDICLKVFHEKSQICAHILKTHY